MLKCKLCDFSSKLSLISHITRKHNISIDEYKKRFENSIVQDISKEQRNNIRKTLKKYNENPKVKKEQSELQKNGGSWRCEKYWTKRGYTKEKAKQKISEKQKEMSSYRTEIKPDENILRKEYWIERHNFVEQNAIKKVSEIQKERCKNSKRFLGKTRDDEQKKKISIGVSKIIQKIGKEEWVAHFGDFKKKCFRSKGEIELYEYVKENINKNAECNVFVKGYNVDILYGNNIIEYFGDYWHCNPEKYEADYYHKIKKMSAKEIWDKDQKKIETLEKNGYNVKIIWENDYEKNLTIY